MKQPTFPSAILFDARAVVESAAVARLEGILDALLAGDADRAARLTSEHIAVGRDRLLAHVDS